MHSRKIKALLMVFVLIVSFAFGNYKVIAENKDVYVSDYQANDGKNIYQGRSFPLSVTVVNNSAGDISNVKVFIINSQSFYLLEAENIDVIEQNKKYKAELEVLYMGKADTDVTVVINYKDVSDENQSREYTININNIVPDDEPGGGTGGGGGGGGGTINKEDFKPVLEITSEAMPEGKAGKSIVIPLTISNIAKYEAREIKIIPTLPEDIFDIEQMTLEKTIDKIPAGKSASAEFRFNIYKTAKAGTYKIPLKIQFKNVYGADFTAEKEIYIKITNDNIPANLVVREAGTNPPVIRAGQNFVLTFDLWNMGTLEAKNVTIDLDPGSDFFVLDNVTKKYLIELKGLNNREFTYKLKAKDGLEPGTYAIKVILGHDDEKGVEYPIYVLVEGEGKEEANVDIVTENINTPQQAVLTEQPFTVSFDVRNIGTTEAKDVKITVESGDKILPQSLNVLTINSVKPGDTVPVSFSFIATKDAESRVYPIKAVIEYNKGDEKVTKEQYMGVLVEGEKEEKSTLNTVPKIIISEYSSDPAMVKAGENFTLHMAFLNTNKLKAVENMKITLVVDEKSEATGGSVFTPVQSSNTFYIDRLGPGETSEKTLVMYTIPDAKAKTYVVTAVFEYEYEENGQLKTNRMEDVFGIPVIQPAKLEVTDVIVSEPAYVGEPVYISSEFYNMGRVKLTNLMVRVESEDFDTRESNYFVGNFDIGYSDYYEASITPLKPGENRGKVVYTFEDAAGEEHRIEKEFTVNAVEAAPVINPFPGDFNPGDFGPYPNMPGAETSKFPIIPVVIGGVVLVGVIVLIIVLKKRKRRKELMLDEDI